MEINIHPTVEINIVPIGEDTIIWQHYVILNNDKIGRN